MKFLPNLAIRDSGVRGHYFFFYDPYAFCSFPVGLHDEYGAYGGDRETEIPVPKDCFL